ncbi:UDP-3-O-(3-hydroxymyristoyl)glucosamine N-acyltransferase [Corallibacter sp.]|uniref:UDP-3-O-(3-hydroxymyristoyl)glucosamine N-acyltransferase n=1 Tax=Corallibacter sp. TaxID=2038084 RepID=UPI003A8E3375
MKKKIYIEELIATIPPSFNYTVKGMISGAFVTNALPTMCSNKESITFIAPDREQKEKQVWIKKSQSKIIITDVDISVEGKINIITDAPKILFSYLIGKFFVEEKTSEIHPTSVISEKAKIGKGCYIGPNTILGDNVTIGDNCIIFGNVTINDRVKIGNNVKIQSGTVIGGEGFGYLKSDKLGVLNFPHIGGVIIEDNVEVGANNTIDRGALADTVLRKDVKTDSLVHIAHNVVIGERTLIMANAMFSGSVTVGKDCWIAPSSSMRDAINIGDNVTVGLGAVVTKSIPPNQVWTGNPARELRAFLTLQNKIKNL